MSPEIHSHDCQLDAHRKGQSPATTRPVVMDSRLGRFRDRPRM